jgi:hypothetical protein
MQETNRTFPKFVAVRPREKDAKSSWRRQIMTKRFIAAVLIGFTLMLALPQRSEAHGAWVPGAIIGGMIFGAAISHAFHPPVYVERRPVYVYPPERAYPYPYRGDEEPGGGRSGYWAHIPGMWIDGRWVPPHRTWVPY